MINNQFVLNFPDGWKESTVYTFEGPEDSGVKHNLVLMIDHDIDKKADLEAYVASRIEHLGQSLPSFELLSKKASLISDSQAVEIVYTYTPGTIPLFQKQYYIHKVPTIFLFTATFIKKTLRTLEPEIDAIVHSLNTIDEKNVVDHFYK
ncbi:MAG: DUF1795 domain-containing protein [Fibrobacter sp.]|nr:DUF1795 domain-containing protein [Fibrobacter sp.]